MKANIGVIIVLFHPKEFNYKELVHQPNISVILIDNTPDSDLKLTSENVYYIPFKQNKGIATAQNAGICKAVELGCSYVVFFDQDSVIEHEYIMNIVDEYKRIAIGVNNLFLLGPTVFNGRTGNEYKSVIHTDRFIFTDFVYRREIISSGSCSELSKILKVGNLIDRLFIDYVDFEWCWRANKLGFVSGITPRVQLQHLIGQNEFKLFGHLVIISAPIRYFYQYRNYLWLIRESYVPFQWKRNTGIKFLLRLLYFPFCVDKWKQIEYNMWCGIRSGLFKYKHL